MLEACCFDEKNSSAENNHKLDLLFIIVDSRTKSQLYMEVSRKNTKKVSILKKNIRRRAKPNVNVICNHQSRLKDPVQYIMDIRTKSPDKYSLLNA